MYFEQDGKINASYKAEGSDYGDSDNSKKNTP